MKYERGVVVESPIDWLFVSKLHYAQFQKRGRTARGKKYERWSWMALFLWAAGA